MKKGKNYFYRVNPESVLSELTSIEHEKWLNFFLDFFHDLRKDDPETATTEIAAQIIKEAHNFRDLRSKAGKASVQQKSANVEHMLKDVQPITIAVSEAITETIQTSTSKMTINDFRFLYSDKFGSNMPGGCNATASELCNQFTKEEIVRAFDAASDQGKCSVAYVKGVLLRNGIKPTGDVFDPNKDYPEGSFYYDYKKSLEAEV